ncbi:putative exonuclease domain-containing protein [Apostasia shenzhenica]|uniref:Putative exonuclease domain-containing protein n=1 Tax=Apostasia shenzhenica TaxID=1088818 RepID=A0A2I0AU95_9ASPA|nr:putative exonuclease domain-containing protein [Apostasia shenzhenica]
MARVRVSLSPLLFVRSNVSPPQTLPSITSRKLTVSASFMSRNSAIETEAASLRTGGWKPMCLYFTQGKCTKMNDASHLEQFSHNYVMDSQLNAFKLNNLKPQDLEYLLVLDLEGKVEIIEFPVVMIGTRTMEFIDSFHRFVRPTAMSEEKARQYIEGKYGKLGVDRVWHDTAVPFKNVLVEFETWLTKHQLWEKETGGSLHQAAFVTCGNWDLKTKVFQQCKTSRIKIPSYFMEWINIKDIYLNFYKRRATGMMTMMRELGIPMRGSHHLGIDDTRNITRVLQRLLADGASLQVTARRSISDPNNVNFLFKNRIV